MTTHPVAPFCPWMDKQMARVPGMRPFDLANFPERDACYVAQMALRDRLIAERPEAVMAQDEGAAEPLAELARFIVDRLDVEDGFTVGNEGIIRPDGVSIARDLPVLERLGRLVQEDLLLLTRHGEEWRLVAGVLCFPSHWTLRQKMGRGLAAIHDPVPFYAETLAARVQRLFDMLRPERPLRRANWLLYPDAELHYPKLEYEQKRPDWGAGLHLRVEHQSLIALPRTGAVVFAIRTEISPVAALGKREREGLLAALDALSAVEYDYKGGDEVRAHIAALCA